VLFRRLLGDNFVLDFVVSCLRKDLLLDEIGLRFVGPPVDDLLRVGSANARQGIELVLRGRIDVQKIAGCRGRSLGLRGCNRQGIVRDRGS
jgi:hypothetical protein